MKAIAIGTHRGGCESQGAVCGPITRIGPESETRTRTRRHVSRSQKQPMRHNFFSVIPLLEEFFSLQRSKLNPFTMQHGFSKTVELQRNLFSAPEKLYALRHRARAPATANGERTSRSDDLVI